jgi:hypothetical protein
LHQNIALFIIIGFLFGLSIPSPVMASGKPLYFGHSFHDTTPNPEELNRKGIRKYMHILTDKQERDSLIAKLTNRNAPAPLPDSIIKKRKLNNFSVYGGKKIRNIYYNRLNVFGTIIDDTSYSMQMKLVRFANKLHYNSREWVLRQALFFRENDTVNAYKMVDNERYLRSLSFIQDARIYVINAYQDPDSIDVVVVTKDLFEYGGTLGNLSVNGVGATIYNNNLLGAGQDVTLGFAWDEALRPQWRGEVSYSKYNLAGSFANVTIGYSALNNQPRVDTGVYERSYFFSINRPLYSSWAKFTGGLTLNYNQSVNIYSLDTSLYRNYKYQVFNLWGGYNFRNQFKNNGEISNKPNLALEAGLNMLNFTQKPSQEIYVNDPNYNNHDYALGSLVFFHQDFFKTNYFFGFGRTEDIPAGYNASTTIGLDHWMGLNRTYAAVQVQKYWLTPKDNLFSGQVDMGTFWYNGTSQDAVIHAQANYYSRLFRWNTKKIRQFFQADYLICPNPNLYKPLNINGGNGIDGYRNTFINGYQRLNLRAFTTYYSRINFIGFRVNFLAYFQGSLLEQNDISLFKSPFYSALGLGFAVRNENLAFNTLQITLSYMPNAPAGVSSVFGQITTTVPLNFNIFALQAPAEIPFR